MANQLCPFCNGGRTKELSLSVSYDGLYLCHRASCGARGKWDSRYCAAPKRTSTWPTLNTLNGDALESLVNTYSLTKNDLASLRPEEAVTCKGETRWWYPIFGPDGSTRGGVARLNGGTPKSLTYVDGGYKLGSWYNPSNPTFYGHAVLVEDQVSAAKLGQYVTTVALMGTNLNDTLTGYLSGSGIKHLYIALDADALSTAVSIANKVGVYFDSCSVICLTKDIKDTSHPEILALWEKHRV